MSTTLEPFFTAQENVPSTGKTVTNYMGMENFVPSYLTQLKMLITCWFLGEPTYYVPSGDEKKDKKQLNRVRSTSQMPVDELKHLYLVQEFFGKTTMNIFIDVVNNALSEDFEAVMKLAVQARNEYMMRSGPCAVLYYAAIHPKRKEFNQTNPMKFREYAKQIIKIPTDAWMLFDMWKQNSGSPTSKTSKQKFPTILKKVLSDHLESMEKYQMKKYLNKSHIVDLIRVAHPRSSKNEHISEVVKKGDLEVSDDELTWERLRSEKKDWKEIVQTLGKMPHMALLRNLMGITRDTNDADYLSNTIMPMLKSGVRYGKQFPFSYMSAWEETQKLDGTYEQCKKVLNCGIGDCIEIAMENFPILEGNTVCLCDNSGSAHSTFPSQYGTQTVAKISNLSGVMTARNCTGKGYVGVFGDKLVMIEVDKNKKILDQVQAVHDAGKTVGGSTENGIWVFFKEAFEEVTRLKNNGKTINRENMIKWCDNICVYSDQQAGSGGLYGTNAKEYKDYIVGNGNYINVIKLIQKYRELVNPKVNVYSVQVAGYNDSLVPEMMYRTHLLSGWNGMETVYAFRMNKLIDEMENSNIMH
ncbi:TROVE domain-containing protein [Fadolivirus algeromassiliense]|jgi:hypothetical protein|uniref:TROVE domain-containing protein n=1 Tax=Fadolivirus FV1/VV64 TaxID=3070911 RepID=A0A7D3R2A6_9VIRU|nr:TROVE domain-containing protein [Fadolivirus algeromassiliense]QKF94358.1 TROVE domain-containing protein [Fadolivirus FV1/VV64]